MKLKKFRRFVSDHRWHVLGLLGVASFVLGYIGFWQYYTELEGRSPALTAPIYGYLTLIVLHGPEAAHPPVALDIARFLTPAVAGWAGLAALALLFRDRLQQMRIPRMKGHVVVCGLGDVGSVFLRHLRDEHSRVVVIESDATNPRIQPCRALGMPVIVGDAQSPRVLESAGTDKASRLLAVCKEDAVNAEIIATANQLVGKGSRSGLRCLARIGDPDLCSLLRIEQHRGKKRATTVDFFNTDEIGARLLLDEFPIYTDGQPPHIVIGHLDPLGAWVVWHAARDWHNERAEADTTPLHVTVIDDDAQERIRTLLGQYPELDQVCRFIGASAHVGDMRRLPRYHHDAAAPPITRAYVTAHRDAQALETALKLRHELDPAVPLVVALSRSHGITGLIRGADSDNGLNIDVFPTLERTCTVELTRGGSFETVAHAVHRRWRLEQIRQGNPAPTWAQLDPSRKESNREQARDITIKLHTIGCDIAPFRDWQASEFDFSRDEIEILAIAEHDRWCKERIDDGWTLGPKDVDRKVNPYLVPWEELPPDIAEWDRVFVREIPAMLASVGLQVIRVRPDAQ
jgi:TrkA-N domain/RyR domain